MYRVLARKYRPQTFADLIGQEVLVRTLSNAFASERIAHAFLLTGIRGIGKTTTARIIARGLNCIGADGNGQPTTEPCGMCPNCIAIAEDRHVDVIEMDAASNTGVDNMRDLIDSVQYAPVSARYKVYIIDEVHMLSKSAFNAILKTLEEPPPHVKFIFATTELRKIPVTIISRCQKFDLKRVELEELAQHLVNVSNKESIALPMDCATLIAAAAEGSVRDALSLLDQAIAMHTDETGAVTLDPISIRNMLGLADKTQTFRLISLIFTGKMEDALTQVRTLHHQGANASMLLTDLLDITHYLTRICVAPALAENLHFSPAEQALAREMVGNLSVPALTRAWAILTKGVEEMRHATNTLATLEMILVRLGYASQLPTPAELVRNLNNSSSITNQAPAAIASPRVSESAPSAASSVSTMPQSTSFAPRDTQLTTARHASPVTATATAHKLAPEPQTVPEIDSFAELVELFETRREMTLSTHLANDMRPVSFAAGRVEVKPIGHIPADVPARIQRRLAEWTGERWNLVYNESATGEPSIGELRIIAIAKQRDYAVAHPKVVAALAMFPDADVEFIPHKK